ncbi:MAG: hypothetical protein ACPLPS_05705 [bacterium]
MAKSIKLANSRGYLDSLFQIYPVEVQPVRGISNEMIEAIISAYKKQDQKRLLELFLNLPRFPFDDPYIATLRHHRFLLQKNPQTVNRIASRLLSSPLDSLIKLATQPKSPSRQLGNSFRKWLQTLGYPFKDEMDFLASDEVAFLKASEKKTKDFIKVYLGVSLTKGVDFVMKIRGQFYLGEAKFITDYGGSQVNQFNYALEVASIKESNARGIAVIDGIVWFKSNMYMHRKIKTFEGIVLSALLLKDFIEKCKSSSIF